MGRAGVVKEIKGVSPQAQSLLQPDSQRIQWFNLRQLLIVIIIMGIIISLASVTIVTSIYKNNLRTRVASIAQAIDAQRVTGLEQSGEQLSSSDYNYLKQRLQRVKSVNADARFLYLMGRNDDGSIYFLVDSEEPGTSGYSRPHEPYPEATNALKGVFENGRTIVEGPTRDSYGDWLSALTPIIDEQSYRMPAVLGMDIPAKTYAVLLGLAGGIPLLLTGLIAGLVTIGYQTRRRREANVHFRAEMISIASHELRTPLTGMRWSEESLLKSRLSAKDKHALLNTMYDSTVRLQDSIEDILQLASLDSAKARRLVLQPADIRALIQGVASMQQLPAQQRNVTIMFSKNWPASLTFDCDAQRLKRVFSNLLSNAIKYSRPDTSVVIGYGRANDGMHIISFQDHGIGIPADEQVKVWSGFYRASNAANSNIGGTGMGLFLSRNVIEQHGGHIWFESLENGGTTVFVSLPESVESTD